MEVIVERPGALNVHKKTIVGGVRVPDGGGGRTEQVLTFPAFLDGGPSLVGDQIAERLCRPGPAGETLRRNLGSARSAIWLASFPS
jgi:hypothetical protein